MTEARPGAARTLPPPPTPTPTPPPTHWQGLRQRFDTLALRPPATRSDESSDDAALAGRDPACRAAVLAWCRQGAGPGGSPFWRPGGWPRVDLPLAVGALQGSTDRITSAWVDHLARELDGSLHLDALPGRGAGLAYRLGVKWHEALWWRQRPADAPWDAGWALTMPAALHRLQTAFWPRRATLVLADAAAWEPLQPALAALWQRQADLRHPLRWLWVGSDVALRALPTRPGLPVTRFMLTL